MGAAEIADTALGSILCAASLPSASYSLCDGSLVAVPQPSSFPFGLAASSFSVIANSATAGTGVLRGCAYGAGLLVMVGNGGAI